MSPEASEVRRWLEKPDHDRRIAALAIEQTPPITDVAAFHAQQAVEKLLKAYLVYKYQEFEKIHDLGELVALCSSHDASFADLRDQASVLTPFAVRFRYPGPADPTVEQVHAALGIVNDIWLFVLSRLPRGTHPSDR